MEKIAIIFGAGKTGRGFAAHLAYLSGYRIVLIDKDEQLVNSIKKEGGYPIRVLGNEEMNCIIKPLDVFSIRDLSWRHYFVHASLVFTAVFGNNLKELSLNMVPGFKERFIKNPGEQFNIITCENNAHAATLLKESVLENMTEEKQVEWLNMNVGFSESMILRTCLDAEEGQSRLTVRAQNFFDLPCDGDAFKGVAPDLYGIKPSKDFSNQLKRKIYTYNCINAVITYLGAQKGYTWLFEAANDPEIMAIARKAARETSDAQVAEFGFDPVEQEDWVQAAFSKFVDINLPDPISRNGADPARKLGREDRLLGPAILALKHGIYPDGLISGILAGFDFYDEDKNIRLLDSIKQDGIDSVLSGICSLSPFEQLYKLLRADFNTNH